MVRVVAASVRGPSHVRDGSPCQDAWLAVAKPSGSLAVVCDGMGSRERAREGARAATSATRDAWRLWRRSPVGSVEDLVRLVEVIWRLRLQRVPADAAATTCLVYAEDGHGRAVVAQLGDGLIARRGEAGDVDVHPSRSEGMGLTHALGTRHTLADWSLAAAAPLAPGEILVLASDGVAEDLEPTRIGDLAVWVTEEVAAERSPARALAQHLRHWPVPHHQDDKTLLVMWKPCNPSSK